MHKLLKDENFATDLQFATVIIERSGHLSLMLLTTPLFNIYKGL